MFEDDVDVESDGKKENLFDDISVSTDGTYSVRDKEESDKQKEEKNDFRIEYEREKARSEALSNALNSTFSQRQNTEPSDKEDPLDVEGRMASYSYPEYMR